MNESDLLTADELAGRLRVRPSTIQRWSRAGRIPKVRLSPKVVRYNLAAVVQAMSAGQKPEGVGDER